MRLQCEWDDPLRMGLAAVGLALLGLLSGCECVDEGCWIDEEVRCSYASDLRTPGWVAAGESIRAQIAGVVGPDGCYHLERIEQEWTGHNCVLRPVAHHVAEMCVTCGGERVGFGEYVSLFRADSGWVGVELETDGPLLIDSTFVRGQPAEVDTFTYTGYYFGEPAVVGWFTMCRPESGVITGEWHFSYADEPVEVGPQIGDEKLHGRVVGTHILIYLSPSSCSEYCVWLDGQLVGNRYTGLWSYCTFAHCPRDQFEAIRQ